MSLASHRPIQLNNTLKVLASMSPRKISNLAFVVAAISILGIIIRVSEFRQFAMMLFS
jgi:hypothetical protein